MTRTTIPAGTTIYTRYDQCAARTMHEAHLVQMAMEQETGEKWSVVDGPIHWQTKRPMCYVIQRSDV